MKRLLVLVAVATLAVPLFASTVLATSSASGTIYWDRPACLGTQAGDDAGSVGFTRNGKWLSGSVSVSGVPNGTYGMLVFVQNSGTCPQGNGVFVGQITVSGGTGSATFSPIKILGNRDGHDVTVVLCIGDATGTHFSVPVTLSP